MYKYPEWQSLVIAAFQTTDLVLLDQRIREAERAIRARMKTLADTGDIAEEQQALTEGRTALQVLRRSLRVS